MLTLCSPMLTLCSPMLALEMLTPIAVTEKAEVGTGWERGGNGVTTGQAGAAAGALFRRKTGDVGRGLPSTQLQQTDGGLW